MKRALVVEDDAALGKTWKRLLSRMGEPIVEVAGTVASALWFLSENEYDIVLCDFQLPDGTGADVYKWVQKKKSHLLPAFFFCTGVPHTAKEACGSDLQFIGKPFGPEDLEVVASRLE